MDTRCVISITTKHADLVGDAEGFFHTCRDSPAEFLDKQLMDRFPKRQDDLRSHSIHLFQEPFPAVMEERREETRYRHAMLFGDSSGGLIIRETTFDQISGVHVIKFESNRLQDCGYNVFVQRAPCVLQIQDRVDLPPCHGWVLSNEHD